MRYLLFLFIIFAASCKSGDKKPADTPAAPVTDTKPAGLAAYQQTFDGPLKAWASTFTGFNPANFALEDTTDFGNTEPDEMGDINELVKIYKPLLYYSPDSSAFIDMYSAQLGLQVINGQYYSEGDVDQGIYLCRPAKSSWKKLLFYGPSAGMEEAAWVNDSTFIMGGIFFNDDGKRVPIIAVGNEATQTILHYSCKDTACVQGEERYTAERVRKLNIKESEL